MSYTKTAGYEPPKPRFKDAADVRDGAWTLERSADQRSVETARVQGMFDGNKPYDPAKLKAKGQAYRSNFNSREAASILSQAMTPFYDLFSSTPHYMEVTVKGSVAESRRLTEEVDELLKGWDDFPLRTEAMLKDYVGFNKGYLFFPDPNSWKFDHIHHHRLYVPADTRMDLDKLEWFVIKQDMPIHTLWANRNKANWGKGAVERAIRVHAKLDEAHRESEWHDFQQRLQASDLLSSVKAGTVWVYHSFHKEWDETWTHCIVYRGGSEGDGKKGEVDYIYKRTGIKRVTQLLVPFFFEVKDGMWNAAGGLGDLIYDIQRHKDRLLNTAVDNGFTAGSVPLQARSAKALQQVPLTQMGNVTVISPDYEITQGRMLSDPGTPVSVHQVLEVIQSKGTGVYRSSPEPTRGNPRTAEEVRANLQQSAVLTNSAVQRFYIQLDRLYREMFARIRKELDIPKELDIKVRAMRASGQGSTFMRQASLQAMTPFMGALSPEGQQNFLADYIAAHVGVQQVDRYVAPAPDRSQQEDQWEAVTENSILSMGGQAMVMAQQNPTIHLSLHFQAVDAILQTLAQGADPGGVLRGLDAFGAHIGQHLQTTGPDGGPWKEQWDRLAQVADQLRQEVQKGTQQEMELTHEQRLKQMELESDIRRNDAKVQAQLRQREERHRQDLKIQAEKSAREMERDLRKGVPGE